MTCLFVTRTLHAIDSVGFNRCRLALKKLLDQEELGKGKRCFVVCPYWELIWHPYGMCFSE